MSTVTLAEAKTALRVTVDDFDVLIQRLIDSAEAECLQFTNLTEFPTEMPADLANGVLLMVQSDFDFDPAKRTEYRRAAEHLWMPYRDNMGM